MAKDWEIELYNPGLSNEWNEFVARSGNATFLFNRQYMDYHSDRFSDCSMIARKGGKIMGLLPANRQGSILYSHQGLTYGGWLLPQRHVDCVDLLSFWSLWLEKCKEIGITKIDYKPIPYIYTSIPREEDRYALFRCGAELTECNISATIDLRANPGLNEMRRRHLRRSSGGEIAHVVSAEGLAEYHKVLECCLAERHNAVPVHSLSEFTSLTNAFPENIQLWCVKVDNRIECGVWLFISNNVVHAQYIASTEAARQENLLTVLFAELIRKSAEGDFGENIRYFDFGISNENHGLYLNENLYKYKSSMGASGVAYCRYSISLAK